VESLNRGLDAARGEFIARMDGDDLSHPERIKRQIQFLDANPKIGLCGTWMKKFGVIQKTVEAVEKPEEIKFCLALNTTIQHATMVARSHFFEEKRIRYCSAHQYAEDYSLFVNLSQVTMMASLQEVLYYYRIHEENVSKREAALVKDRAAKVRLEYLQNNLSDIFPPTALEQAAFSWCVEDRSINEETLEQILAVYKKWYNKVFEFSPLNRRSVLQAIINDYFLYLLRYNTKKGVWTLPYYLQRDLYNPGIYRIARTFAASLFKK
jgi:glycosyltransferase involved in cell wall biosynthesis